MRRTRRRGCIGLPSTVAALPLPAALSSPDLPPPQTPPAAYRQVMFLNHALAGFAGSTAFLYLLLATADLRVAVCLPRARVFCLVSAASHCTTAGIFLYLSLGQGAVTLPVPYPCTASGASNGNEAAPSTADSS